jgi:hypothetical protein
LLCRNRIGFGRDGFMRSQGSSSGIVFLLAAFIGIVGGGITIIMRLPYLITAVLLTIGSLALIAGFAWFVRTGRNRPTTTIVAPPQPAPPQPQPPLPSTPVAAAPPVAPPAPVTPQAPTLPSVPMILPAPGPLFIGREQELDHLIASLRRARGATAIAVVGPAGTGKHTLINRAVEAHQMEETFSGGYSWHAATDFHGDMGLRRLLIEVLDRLGGPAVAMTTTLRMGEAAVADLVRGKRMLFWLDDVPDDFPIGRAITTLTARNESGIGPTLILSSRSDWAIPEITEIVLEPPQLDEAMDLVREWMDVAGRATTGDDYEAIKAICVNLSSLPLALRLAAGFAAQSGAKLPKLAGDLGSAVYPPGDLTRTPDQTIAFVEAQLFPQPRRAFGALAVFEQPIFDLDAACVVAAAVSGGSIETTRSDLESMIRLGLLEPDGDDHHPQLRMHPLVKRYAAQRLEALGPDVTTSARAALASMIRARQPAGDDLWQPSQPATEAAPSITKPAGTGPSGFAG